MNERIAVLLVALLLELLGGLGLHNESLATRGRIEVYWRCEQKCQQRIDFLEGLYHQVTTPENLQRAIERRNRRAELANLPQL